MSLRGAFFRGVKSGSMTPAQAAAKEEKERKRKERLVRTRELANIRKDSYSGRLAIEKEKTARKKLELEQAKIKSKSPSVFSGGRR